MRWTVLATMNRHGIKKRILFGVLKTGCYMVLKETTGEFKRVGLFNHCLKMPPILALIENVKHRRTSRNFSLSQNTSANAPIQPAEGNPAHGNNLWSSEMTVINRRKLMVSTMAAAGASLLGGCKSNSTSITYEGATTPIAVLSQAAEAYLLQHPNQRIAIAAGGSTVGVSAVASRKADFGGLARDLTPEEKSQVLYFPFAKDGLAIVVHDDVHRTDISRAELKEIYSANVAPDGMTRIAKTWAHGTSQTFAEGVNLELGDVQSEALVGSNGKMLASIAAISNSIGYVSMSDANAAIMRGAPIRILSVEGVTPSVAALTNGSYPLARTLWLTLPKPVAGQVKPAAADFVAFLLGPEVGKMLSMRGFVPFS